MSRGTPCGVSVVAGGVVAVVTSALSLASVARAADGIASTPLPDSPVVAVSEPLPTPDALQRPDEGRIPNFVMIGAGVVAFGFSYGIATVVGATSSHRGDGELFVPAVGPWLDLGDRGSCGAAGGRACDLERGNRTGLVIDGIFQGVGLLAFASGFVFPVTRETATGAAAALPKFRLAPAPVAQGGVGLVAVASF